MLDFADCHAVFAKMARNDGGICHFEPLQKGENSKQKPALSYRAIFSLSY